jgi:hypothetical protein
MMNISTGAVDLRSALTPFAIKASDVLPVPMLRRYSKWIRGNEADTALALRSECQTHLGDLVLSEGPVTKHGQSIDGRRPENTTWLGIPTATCTVGAIVRNVKRCDERQYRFLTEASPEISAAPGKLLLDVSEPVQSHDVVIGIERTRMTKKRPASLSVKVLIGNIDHRSQRINVEEEIVIFAEALTVTGMEVPVGTSTAEEAKSPIVPLSSKRDGSAV